MNVIRCGSGEPILFIHGMPTSGRLWKGIIDRLCERYTCIAVDLPGLGNSPREPYDPNFLRHFAEEIDRIRIENKIDKWHIVGHDAGSVVAVHYARYFPERVSCLALLSPALFPELKPFYLLEALRKPILGELLAPLKDFYRPFSGLSGSWAFMRVLRWGKPATVLAEVPGFLPTLTMPTLIFHGTQDVAIPEAFALRASTLMPNASMVTLESGHFIPLHQPEPVATGLACFFDRHAPLSVKAACA
jgi:pimeloyl-ACP methyl ester carboxylesterase